MDDAALVQDAVGGSVPAFSGIFDRYGAEVHDLALSLLRDRRVAAEVVQATIWEVSERIDSLKQPERLRVWLLAVTRFHAARKGGDQAGLDRQPVGTDPIPERAQLAGLVWEATADLPLRERALLDLQLRHDLDEADLADALGVSLEEVAEMQAGLKTMEMGLAGYVLTRRGERRCPDLPLLLRGWDGRFTPLVATHLAGHVDGCRVCRETTADLPSPLALYASVPQAPLPGPVEAGRPAEDPDAVPEARS